VDLDLTGKLALVTGSTRGIGLATVTGLARMGAAVIVNGRTDAAVTEAIARVQAAVPGAVLRGTSADLSDAAGCARLIDAHPEVDILVNNLGIYEIKPFLDTPDADWQRMFAVNVMGGVRLTRHYLARMLATRNWGRVVFVSSESGVRIPAEMVHYGFSKGAQLVIARGAAELTAGTGITVNSVLPGPTWVETRQPRLEARAQALGISVEEAKARTFTERRPTSLLRRYATAEEVANPICYVCSKAASATNGAALRVDGGIVTNPF
jgi:NAD(P)-dependent dehydrogenase (short-subunit alcohol dehydrogenase family)